MCRHVDKHGVVAKVSRGMGVDGKVVGAGVYWYRIECTGSVPFICVFVLDGCHSRPESVNKVCVRFDYWHLIHTLFIL